MAGQQARGNISLMERTRLEAFLLNLRSERMQLQNMEDRGEQFKSLVRAL
jgi:hypothetical protein